MELPLHLVHGEKMANEVIKNNFSECSNHPSINKETGEGAGLQ